MFEKNDKDAVDLAKKEFAPRLGKYKRQANPWRLTFQVLGLWIMSLVVLFVLTAYRPEGIGWSAINWTAGSESTPLVMENNEVPAFREYLGRMVGAIPPECAITELSLPQPRASDTAPNPGDNLVARYALPKLEPGLQLEECRWRDRWSSILVAISPDVGSIQKLTLLLCILGLVMVGRHRNLLAIEGAAWPERDSNTEDLPANRWINHQRQAVPELACHPVTLLRRSDEAAREFIYPMREIWLDPLEGDTRTQRQFARMAKAGERLSDEHPSLSGPIDLMIDVFRAGAHSGRKAEAERRMRVAVYEYRDRLSGGLEMAHYLMWLLPTVGFLGTIYGISASLVRTKGLFGSEGELSEFQDSIGMVVDGLGVAFDTTSMALLCSAYLYWRLVKAEANVNTVADSAAKSLSNILIQMMRDRDAPRPTANPQPATQLTDKSETDVPEVSPLPAARG